MFTLYDYLPSQNGWKVRVLFGLLDIPYQTRLVSIFEGEGRTEGFLDLNPAGGIPVLELEDGRTIAESNAILCYVAEDTRFLPADRYERAKVMQWLFFEQYHVEPVIGTLRFWTMTGRLELQGSMVEAKRTAARRALAGLERGDLTIADIAVYAYGHRAGDCGFVLTDYPALTAWFGRVREAIGPGYSIHLYNDDPHSAM
ncbi:glutathione S-transferase family protein [Rhizobium sp. SYY.PMSO]|uniref:glutathione S-transferase family protein n=1 Tax=Rhizobium sp. SYY.PMSO TaxID=3382192 RepID=UPI00399029E4